MRMMHKTALLSAGLGLVLAASSFVHAAGPGTAGRTASASARAVGQTAPSSAASSPGAQRALIDSYCVTCHNQKAKVAGLTLDTMDVEHLGTGTDVWEKVVRKLRTGSMPPTGARRPDAATLAAFATSLETSLDRQAAAAPNPGRPIVHRLNRAEYTNVIRDLLALKVDGKTLLPTDTSGSGFDNIGDVLSISPALLERYLIAAQQISRLAVGDSKLPPVVETHRVPFSMLQEDRMSDELPFGSRGGTAFKHYFPSDGEYIVKVRMQRSAMSNGVRGEGRVNQVDVRLDGTRLQLFTIGGKAQAAGFFDQPKEIDQGLDIRVPVKAGERLVAVSFQRAASEMEGIGPSHLPTGSYGYAGGTGTSVTNGRIEMGVDFVEIVGPFESMRPRGTASRKRIFTCQPVSGNDEAACARRIVSTIARRAYRRSVTEAEIKTLLGFYDAERRQGGFEAGIQRAIERVLVSPDFLFRAESEPVGPHGPTYRVSDVELASRLSFFLWSSIPDDELLDTAVKGQLRSRPVLAQQVRRMLANEKSRALLDNFFGQWLFLRNISLVRPDPKAYPEFDENLRSAFRTETELFLRSQVRDDHSALDLLTANYTFVNERLAKFYGIPNIYGDRFRRVTYADDRRAGILGQAAILTTINSYANRTSPVKRGQWLLENLLGTPPPPPPANVPPFPENDGSSQPKSVRELMEQHRKNPVCATCHSKLDPLGFALENFNGIGKWRDTDSNVPIDASGMLSNGTPFKGPAEFRKALLENRESFLMTLTGKLMTYSLGRGVEYYDMPTIRKILRETAPHDYRWSSLIMSIVTSDPFQMRRSES